MSSISRTTLYPGEGTVPNDLRFTRADEVTELPYWIESSDANTAKVWGKYNSIGTTDTYFCVYYGKSGDTTTSNGGNTFLFFDDFPGSSLDTAKWEGDLASMTVADSILTLPGSTTVRNILSTVAIPQGARVCQLVKTTSSVKYNYLGGFSSTIAGDQDRAITYTNDTSLTIVVCSTMKAGSATNANHNVPDVSTQYRIYEITWKSGEAKFYQDGTLITTRTTNVPDVDQKHRLWASEGGTGKDSLFQWIFTSKYIDPEPTWGTWGTEESAGFPPHSTGFIIG